MIDGRSIAWLPLLGSICLGACGGGEQPAAETPMPAQQTTGYEQPRPRSSMDVEGLMGTIPERKIHATLEPMLPKFQRCFFHGAEEVEFIGGHIDFYFRVGVDGLVEWVYPRGSSIGHRGTERCLLEQARTARFPKPRGGGAAELAWGFELDGIGTMRPPVAWDSSRASAALAQGKAALSGCGSGSYEVTAYVAPGGQVLGARRFRG